MSPRSSLGCEPCHVNPPNQTGDYNFELQPQDNRRHSVVDFPPVSADHNLRTISLNDIRLPPAQTRRVERAMNRHNNARRSIMMKVLPSLGVTGAPRPARSGEGRRTPCHRKRCNRRRIGAQLSKKDLVHTLRDIVRVRTARRLQERASVARALHQAHFSSDDGDGDNAAISSIKSSSNMVLPQNWQHLSTDDNSSAASSISTFATGSSKSLLLEECSVKPFVSLMKILRLASDVPGSVTDFNSKSSGVFSSVDSEGSGTFPARALAEGFNLRRGGGNEAGNIFPDWDDKIFQGSVRGGRTYHHWYYGDDDALTLSDAGKIDDSLTALRTKARFSLPRHSPSRRRIAAARIDSILLALVADGLMDESRGGSRSSGFKGNRNGDKGPVLNLADIETVVAHVDTDQSGEVDAKELEVAISAAKQGKLKDAQLTRCMLKIDDELHLWHLRTCDLFDRLDADGSGTLSYEELTEGLSMLCGHDRVKIIQRRQELRRRKGEQQAREAERRAHVMSFISNLESLPEEIMQDREFFAADVTDRETFHELVKRISRKSSEEVIDDDTTCRMSDKSSDDDGEDGRDSLFNGSDGNVVRRRRTSRSTTKVLGSVEAQLERLKESLLLRTGGATAGQKSHLLAEGTEVAGGTVHLAEIVSRGRSAAISTAAATAAFAKSPMKKIIMPSPARSSDEGAANFGGLRGESKFHPWSSPADAVKARTRHGATEKTAVIAADSGRDEDLILPGESLFGFSEAAGSGEARLGGTLDIGGECLSQQRSSPFSPAISFQANALLPSGPGATSGRGDLRGNGADSASSKTPSLLHSLNAVIKSASARGAGTAAARASATGTAGTEAEETPPNTIEAKPSPKLKLSGSGRRATASDDINAEASGTGDAATGRRCTRSMKRPRQGAGTAPADVDASESKHPALEGGGNPCNSLTMKTKLLQDSGPVAAESSEEMGIRIAEQSGSGGATTGTDLSTPSPAPMDSGSSPRNSVMSVGAMELIPGFEGTLDSNFMTALLEDAEGQVGMDASMAFPDDDQEDLHVSMGLAEALLQENDTQPDVPTTRSGSAEDRGINEKGEGLHSYEDLTTQKAAFNERVSLGEEIEGVAASTKTPPSHQMPRPLSPIPLANNVAKEDLTLSTKPPLPSRGSIAKSDGPVGTRSSQRCLTPPKGASETVDAAQAKENARSMSLGVSGSSPRRPVREGTAAGAEGAPQNGQAGRKCHQDPDWTLLSVVEPFTPTDIITKGQAAGPTSTGGDDDNGEMRSSPGQPALPRVRKDCVMPETVKRARRDAAVVRSAPPPLPRKVSLRFAPRENSTQEKVSSRGYLPFQKLTAPLSKPLEAVFKFMRKKWREVAVSDLNNVRIVCDAATTSDAYAELRASPGEHAPSYRATIVWGAEHSAESLANLLNSLPEPARARLCEKAFLDLTYTFKSGAVGPPPHDVSSIWEDPPVPVPVTLTAAPRSTPSSTDRASKSDARAAPSSSAVPSPPSPLRRAASEVQAPAVCPPGESGGDADDVVVIEEALPPAAVVKGVTCTPRRTGIGDERPVFAATVGNETPKFERVPQKDEDKAPGRRRQKLKKAVSGRAPKPKPTSKRHRRSSRSTIPTVTLTDAICNRALVGGPLGAHVSALASYHGYMPGGIFATMHAMAMADRLRAVERAGGTFFPPVMPLATAPFVRELSRAALSVGSVGVAPSVAAPANGFPVAEDPFRSMNEANNCPLAKCPSSNEEIPLETPAMDRDAGDEPDGEGICDDVVDGELIGEDSCMAAFGEFEINLLLEASRSQRSEGMVSTAENGADELPRSSSSPAAEAETDEEGYIDVAAVDEERSPAVAEPQSPTRAGVTKATEAVGWETGGEGRRRAEVDAAAAVDSVPTADGPDANGACRLQASLPLASSLRTGNVAASVSVAEADHEEASVEAAEYANGAKGAANLAGAGAWVEAVKTAGGRPKTNVNAVSSVDPAALAVPRLGTDESTPPLGARPTSTQLDPRTEDGTNMTEGEKAVLPNVEQLGIESASSAARKTLTARDDAAGPTAEVKSGRGDAGALHPTTSSGTAEQPSLSHDDAGEAHARGTSPDTGQNTPQHTLQTQPQSPASVEATTTSCSELPEHKLIEEKASTCGPSRSSRHDPSHSLSSLLHPLEMRNLQERALRSRSLSVEGGCPAPATAASTPVEPDSLPSRSSPIQLLPTAEREDACPSGRGATEPDASSFDCFQAEPLLEAEKVAAVDTGGSNLRLRNEESWSSVAAAALDISALVDGLGATGSQDGSNGKDGSSRLDAEGPAVFGGSGGESLRQPAEERPKPVSKKASEAHASGSKASAGRVPTQQEAHRPTDVGGAPLQAATATAAAGRSVSCGGDGAVTTTDDAERLASPPDSALHPLSSRPFAFATVARKVDRVTSSACTTTGQPAPASTTTSAQPASATRTQSAAPNVAASLMQTLSDTPQSRGELALIQPLAGGAGASREEVQASYAEAWSSFPSCYFWDESSIDRDAHVQADADTESKPPATRDDPVARWLALSRAEASLEGLLTSSIASAAGDVSAGAGCEYEGEGQKRYTPFSASPCRDDVSISASGCRTNSSHSEDLGRALATDRASEEANPLPTLIRLGRSMTKGLTPTEAPEKATVRTDSADASPSAAPFAAPSKSFATDPPRAIGNHGCNSKSSDFAGSRRGKRDRRENDENVEHQAVWCGRGGGVGGEGGDVLPRPRKRPKRARIAPTLVCSLPSAPAMASAAAPETAFSH